MKIEIHLYASLAKFLPKGSKNKFCVIEMRDHSDIGDLIDRFNLPVKSVKLIFLNGTHAGRSSMLRNGDRVGIFPPVGGG